MWSKATPKQHHILPFPPFSRAYGYSILAAQTTNGNIVYGLQNSKTFLFDTGYFYLYCWGKTNSGHTHKKRSWRCRCGIKIGVKRGWKSNPNGPKLSPYGPKVPEIIPKRSQNSPELVPKRPSMTPEMVPKWSAACSLCDFSTSTLFLRQRRFFPLGCDFFL